MRHPDYELGEYYIIRRISLITDNRNTMIFKIISDNEVHIIYDDDPDVSNLKNCDVSIGSIRLFSNSEVERISVKKLDLSDLIEIVPELL